MSGLRLEELWASDMLDVIHFIFEDDLFAATKEESEHKSHVRTVIYNNFYERQYKYAANGSSSKSFTTASGELLPPLDEEFNVKPFDPNENSKSSSVKTKPKPYIAPTNFNPDSVLPFGKNIDAPLG